MAKLQEKPASSIPTWDEVYQLEDGEWAFGGAPTFDVSNDPITGNMNAQAQKLLDRTTALRNRNGSHTRNCVLSGNISESAPSTAFYPAVLELLTDTTMRVKAGTGNEVVLSFADGFGKLGPRDYIATIDANTAVNVSGILAIDARYTVCAEFNKSTGAVTTIVCPIPGVGIETSHYTPSLAGGGGIAGRLWWNDMTKKMYKSVVDGGGFAWSATCAVSIGSVLVDSGILDSVTTYKFGEMYEMGTEETPVGSVMAFAGFSAPKGWLMCNGASVEIREYRDLYDVITTTFGSSTGAFNLPDLRGRFVRGFDSGAGNDPGRAFGDVQADALAAHTHTVASNNAGGAGAGAYLAGSGSTNATVTTSSAGSTETRPKNISMNYIIKY